MPSYQSPQATALPKTGQLRAPSTGARARFDAAVAVAMKGRTMTRGQAVRAVLADENLRQALVREANRG